MKLLLLLGAMLLGSLASAGQNHVPDVIVHSNCTNKPDVPAPRDWFQKTRLPYGEPYTAPDKQKELILENYPKLKPGMSLADAENLLGKPDFLLLLPRARLANQPEPQLASCRIQVAYILRKNSDNLMDMDDVGVFLAFSETGRLYWATPQNVPQLTPIGSPE